MKKRYELTDEHRAMLPGWRDKWISNAMSTEAMTDDDRRVCIEAVHGLYAAAKLPPPKHIVFVPSPFVLSFAGGFAAAIWHRRRRVATYEATSVATSVATYVATHRLSSLASTKSARCAKSIRSRTRFGSSRTEPMCGCAVALLAVQMANEDAAICTQSDPERLVDRAIAETEGADE